MAEIKKVCDNNCETCNQTSWLHCSLLFSKRALEKVEKLEKQISAQSIVTPPSFEPSKNEELCATTTE